MDRKEFLKVCGTCLCACAAACMPAAAAGDDAAKDWRLPFVKQRYARLLGILSERMDGPTLAASLQELGAFCAAQGAETEAYRGDVDGFCKYLMKHSTKVTTDRERGVYTMEFSPKTDCFCPLNSRAAGTPSQVCECSIGWVRYHWGIVLKKEPEVVAMETVLRGGQRCAFEIRT
jgi:hypothetical protein